MESSYARSLSLASMRVLILKPHELADPVSWARRSEREGADLHEHVLADAGPPPLLDGFDAIVVMGAPWSVYGDEVRDWIGPPARALREAVSDDDARARDLLRRAGVRRGQRRVGSPRP